MGEIMVCRNPYFNGILSAISRYEDEKYLTLEVAILILMESFLQLKLILIYIYT